jgi:hypothetical protein
MSRVHASGRSFQEIRRSDCKRLAEIARKDLEDRFARKPRWKRLYAERVLCVALCQGAAMHLLQGVVGIHDFDVWTFFANNAEAPFPPRWRVAHDFGDARFGQSPDSPAFVGRRVDCIGRSIDAVASEEPRVAIRRYLIRAGSDSARLLAKKAIVLLAPENQLGEVVWPLGSVHRPLFSARSRHERTITRRRGTRMIMTAM